MRSTLDFLIITLVRNKKMTPCEKKTPVQKKRTPVQKNEP